METRKRKGCRSRRRAEPGRAEAVAGVEVAGDGRRLKPDVPGRLGLQISQRYIRSSEEIRCHVVLMAKAGRGTPAGATPNYDDSHPARALWGST